jgi:hypothetical protein
VCGLSAIFFENYDRSNAITSALASHLFYLMDEVGLFDNIELI